MTEPTEQQPLPPGPRAPEGNRLLMHICCGPCACICIRTLLAEGWNITGYFMNPNIQPLAEYLRRHEAAEQTCVYFGIPILFDDAAWNITDWLRAVQNRDTPPERCTYGGHVHKGEGNGFHPFLLLPAVLKVSAA